MKILFKYPSRQRPDQFFEGMDNIVRNAADKENYHIACTIDEDDHLMNNPDVISRIRAYAHSTIVLGKSTSKVHAVNRNLNDGILPEWQIVVCMSDDMRWRTYGFDNIIREFMPESLDGFLHAYDDYAGARVCTVSILGYRYYQRDMYIYNPSYYSMWCDDEATEVAKRRGCYIHVPGISLEHLHYTNNRKAVKDELYWRNDTYNADKEIFEQRKARNFDL